MNKILLIGQPIHKNRKGYVGSGGGYVRNMRVYLKYFQTEDFNLIPCFHTSRKEYGINIFSKIIRIIIDIKRIIIAFIKEKPSAIHIMAQYRKAIAREAMYTFVAEIFNKPILYEIKAGAFIDAYNSGSNLYKKLVKYILDRSKVVLVEGEKYIPFLKEKLQTNSYYFPNVVPDVEAPDSKNGILTSDKIKLLYVGHCNYEKGIFHLVDAFRNLVKENHDIELNLIGEEQNDFREYLDQTINKYNKININRFGGMPHDFILSKMQECDIFCFPSFHSGEGHSNSINEAMMNSMVIVSTKNGFLRDILNDKIAYFISEKSSEDIENAIIRIIENRDEAIAKAKEGYLYLKKNYTVSNVKDIIEMKYGELISNA